MIGRKPREDGIEQDWWVRAAGWAGVVLLVGFVAFCGFWRLDDGRWQRVETPSMGTTAPVGTLLWVKPVDFDSLQVGDFITFYPPGRDDVTYSHLVDKLNDDGTISTKGEISAPDPWKLTSADIVGEVKMSWWGVGWLVLAAPMLFIGFVIVAMIRRAVSRDWKLPITILLGTIVITVAIVWYRPFLNAERLGFASDDAGGGVVTYIGTGLLPIRVSAVGATDSEPLAGSDIGSSVVMRDGEVGQIRVERTDDQPDVLVELSPAVPWWVLALLVLVCFLPALYSLLIGFAPRPDKAPRHRDAKESELQPV